MGRKNSAGDWILTEADEAEARPTICPQIFITYPADTYVRGYVLTHAQSGLALLWGFDTIRTAEYCAGILMEILPISEWDAMAQAERRFTRARVADMLKRLPPGLRDWIRAWNIPSTKKAERNGNKNR